MTSVVRRVAASSSERATSCYVRAPSMVTRNVFAVLVVLTSGCAAGASASPAASPSPSPSPSGPSASAAKPAPSAATTTSSAPAPDATAVPASTATLLAGKKPDEALPVVKRILAAAGHACIVDEPAPGTSTLVCDKDDPGKPTLGVVYVTRNKTTRLTFASGFSWKMPGTCAQKAARFNELNRGTDVLKVFCNEEAVTWTATLVVPSLGLTDEDVAGFTAWFAGSVQAVLHESGLVPLLR